MKKRGKIIGMLCVLSLLVLTPAVIFAGGNKESGAASGELIKVGVKGHFLITLGSYGLRLFWKLAKKIYLSFRVLV